MKKIKITILTIFMFLLMISSVSALTINYDSNVSCSGKLTYSDKILSMSNLYDTDKYTIMVQATAGYPEPNLFVIDANCNPQYNSTYAFPTHTPANMVSDDTYTYYRAKPSVGNDEIYKFQNSDLSYVSKCSLDSNYGLSGMMFENDQIHILMTNGTYKRFGTNCIWIDDKSPISSISGCTYKGLSRLTDDTLILQCDSDFYEVTDDYSTLLQTSNTVASISSYEFVSMYNEDKSKFTLKTETDSIEIWNITDVFTANYFVFNGVNYSKNLCVSSDTYCSDTQHTYDVNGDLVLYCSDTNETTFCSGGCENTLVNDQMTGVCSQLGCTNECNVVGQDTCTTQNTYARCGQYDADACLEYGSVLTCPSTQYCYEDQTGAFCDVATSEIENLYNVPVLDVTLNLVNNTGVKTSEGYKDLEAKSQKSVANWVPLAPLINKIRTSILESKLQNVKATYQFTSYEDLSDVSTDYYAHNCNYEETFVIRNDYQTSPFSGLTGDYTHNNTFTYPFLLVNDSVNQTLGGQSNQVIELFVEPEENGTSYVKIYDGTTLMTSLRIENDVSNFNIQIYEDENNQLIVNSTSTSDDLQEIFFGLSFITNINTVNVEVQLVREVLGVDVNEYYYSLPLSTDTDTTPSKINVQGTNTRFYQYNVFTVNEYPVFSKDEEKNKDLSCTYDKVGCFVTKVYGNTQGIPTYYFNDEYEVCVSELEGQFFAPPSVQEDRSEIEKILGKTMNDKQKTLFAIFALIVVIGAFIGFSFVLKDNLPTIIGTVIDGFLLFYFVLEGFLEAWVIIIFIILGVALATFLFRKGVTGV